MFLFYLFYNERKIIKTRKKHCVRALLPPVGENRLYAVPQTDIFP